MPRGCRDCQVLVEKFSDALRLDRWKKVVETAKNADNREMVNILEREFTWKGQLGSEGNETEVFFDTAEVQTLVIT